MISDRVKELSKKLVWGYLKPRQPDANKGDFGHVLVVGGDCGMSGAPRLCAVAALRTGAGLVSIATKPDHATVMNIDYPELMVHGVDKAADLKPLLKRATVVALGPGLGQSSWAQQLLSAILATDLPLVVDADALNLLAKQPSARDNWVITPHPGEAARLLAIDSYQVQQDREKAVALLNKKYHGISILKGAGTLIADKSNDVFICRDGNPGMACAGMGDVLTGIIASLIAQGLTLSEASRLGVYLHAQAGDLAAADGSRGMIASDLFPYLRRLVSL